MENPPEVFCKHCYRIQTYVDGKPCIQCGMHFSNWHVAQQLQKAQPQKTS